MTEPIADPATESPEAAMPPTKPHWLTADLARKLQVVAALLAAGGVAMFVLFAVEWNRYRRLREEGVLVEARVPDPDSYLGVARGRALYPLYVIFVPQGGTSEEEDGVRRTLKVPEAVFERALEKPYTIPIRYMPDDLTFVGVEGEISAPDTAAAVGVTLLITALVVWCYVWFARRKLSARETAAR